MFYCFEQNEMKILKAISVIVLAVVLFLLVWMILIELLTEVNPNYIVLENDEKGYVMNTENVFLALLISIAVSWLTLRLVWSKLKRMVRKQTTSKL